MLQRPNHAAMTELLREAEIMARLRHPNIVLVYGVVLPEAAPELPPDDDDDEFGLDPLGPIQIGAVVAAVRPSACCDCCLLLPRVLCSASTWPVQRRRSWLLWVTWRPCWLQLFWPIWALRLQDADSS